MTAIRILIAFVVIVGGCLLLKTFDTDAMPDLAGIPVACTNSFHFREAHAEILEYGLQDVRGLACDDSGENVFISERDRSLLVYSTTSGSLLQSRRVMCPNAPCDVADRRGLAFMRPELFVATHGRAEILVRDFERAPVATGELEGQPARSRTLPGTAAQINGPNGLAAAENMLFITNDPEYSDSERRAGALYTCSADDCQPVAIAGYLQHPSGVAAAAKDGPVYVAEMGAHEVNWPIFRNVAGRGWVRSGSLGSAGFSGKPSMPFLGIAIDSQSNVFAAGPGGLYIFEKGHYSGRMLFDDAVSGVTTCGTDVYFAMGHMLCRLKGRT